MTNKQILKKAIEKAYKNGWGKGVDDRKLAWTIAHDVRFMLYQYWYSIIFSHDFAKAFWGWELVTVKSGYDFFAFCEIYTHSKRGAIEWEKKLKGYERYGDNTLSELTRAWRYHLQQMVLEKEPLKYLERFIK